MFNGLLYQRSLRTKNKTEATQLEAVSRSSLVKGEFGIIESRKAPTLEKFEERLLPHLRANTAPRTYGFYKEHVAVLKRFVPLASCKLGGINSALIENFIQWRLKEGVSARAIPHDPAYIESGSGHGNALDATHVLHQLGPGRCRYIYDYAFGSAQ